MVLGLMLVMFIVGMVTFAIACENEEGWSIAMCLMSLIIGTILLFYGKFNGFIEHKPTEGVHQGVITAVDLEGQWFRRYEVYLKSSAYTTQGDETKYLIYDYEKELAEELQNAIGKSVKLYYGFDGGYIKWNSCGTYHIKKVEILEEK